jgi:hypothetical protein
MSSQHTVPETVEPPATYGSPLLQTFRTNSAGVVGTCVEITVDDCSIAEYVEAVKRRMCYRDSGTTVAGPGIGICCRGREPIKAMNTETSKLSVIERFN